MINKVNIKKLFLVVIFLATSLLALYHYGDYSYDLDEYYSINFAQTTKIDTNILNKDLGNPPLFFLILIPWIKLFGTKEIATRLLPLIFFGASSVIFQKILTQLKFKKFIKIILILLFFGMNQFYILRIYVRAYSLLLFLILMTVYLTYFILNNKYKKNNIFKLALTIFAGFASHYIYGLFFILWFSAVILVYLEEKIYISIFLDKKYWKQIIQDKKIKSILLSATLGIIISSPILLNLFSREFFSENNYYFHQLSSPWPGLSNWLYILTKAQFFYYMKESLSIIIWVFILGTFLFISKKLSPLKRIATIFTSLTFLIYFFSPIHNYLSHIKYFAFIIPFFYITLFSVITLFISNKKPLPIYGKLIILGIVSLWTFNFNNLVQPGMNEDWKGAAKQATLYAKPNKPIFVSIDYYAPIARYYLKQVDNTQQRMSYYNQLLIVNDEKKLIKLKESAPSFVHINRYFVKNNKMNNLQVIEYKEFGGVVVGYLE